MVICECCNGNCDNGELIQGVCPECYEKKEKQKAMRILSEELLKMDFSQMSFGMEEMQNV